MDMDWKKLAYFMIGVLVAGALTVVASWLASEIKEKG
jgi:hypothetical protein